MLETKQGVYIFEFKYGRSAEAALAQCRDRNYAAPYANDARAVYYIGVNYDPAVRTVDDVLCEAAKLGRPPSSLEPLEITPVAK